MIEITNTAGLVFATGHAKDADDRIVHMAGSGDLLFDADGNGSGKAVVFAHLNSGLALAESDFRLTLCGGKPARPDHRI